MIKIEYIENDNFIEYIKIHGHANYDDYGKDIICSAVSAISIGALNALKNIENYTITQSKGLIILKEKNEPLHDDNVVLNTMIVQLKTIENSYPDFIKICKID